jgi:hypothetical protein
MNEMLTALTVLKAVIIIAGMAFFIKKVLSPNTNNKLRTAFKIIGIIFLILILITVIEFFILGVF